ncbi:hypothetical protein [Brevibacillus sp. NRS-1366]|uniref:hypothetical protein n=1 Tax=Brevibacillus sp. NRS-1366 TaxID=3233899 RepID=UPI003D1EEFC0
MTQLLGLGNPPRWLEEEYFAKKKRTFHLGKEAIDHLYQNGERVSYRNIESRSKELDPKRKGIHANSVKANEELYQYYLKFASFKKAANNHAGPTSSPISNKNGAEERDWNERRERYSRLSKSELVDRLLEAELYISERKNG